MRRLLPARAWPGISVVAIGLTALLLVLVVDAPSTESEAADKRGGGPDGSTVRHARLDGGTAGPALARLVCTTGFPRRWTYMSSPHAGGRRGPGSP